MSDLVERLRRPWAPSRLDHPLMTEAADTITALRAENERLTRDYDIVREAHDHWVREVERLRSCLAKQPNTYMIAYEDGRNRQLARAACKLQDELEQRDAENEWLRAALRAAYEVYAGSDGFIPETAAEGYQQQIIKQMVDCISEALEGKP
jgi:hypothetical protein